jgi:hypothetical protein
VYVAIAALNEKMELLPLYKQQEVMDFVDFLLDSISNTSAKKGFVMRKHPYAGCMSGTFGQMSDDFNEPLDDFKDYM